MAEVVATVDIGTTAAKAALITPEGHILRRGQVTYPLYTGPHGEMEQKPEDWWNATCQALHACEPQQFHVLALIFSGQMQDLIAIGQNRALRPAILYSDQRASIEFDLVLQTVGVERWHRLTGNLQDASSLPAKMLWLKRREPDVYRDTEVILLGAHDYITWRACGARVTDLTTASTTGLLNLRTNRFLTELLKELGLRTDWLPELSLAEEVVGRLSPEAAEAMGLPAGIPVFHGAGDAATTTVGVGAGEPGRSYLYLGTSGWLAASEDGRMADPLTGIFTLRHPNSAWTILIGPMMTAGGNLEWMRRQQMKEIPYDTLSDLAASSAPGSHGVIYLPYLAGERCPFRDSHVRAAFIGLSTYTSWADMVRAVLEGVAFGFRSIAEAIWPEYKATPIQELFIAGGGSRSSLWCQIISDVLNCTVHRTAAPEDVAARGAFILAGKGLGWYESYVPSPEMFPIEATFAPRLDVVATYARYYAIFRDLYPVLRDVFSRIQAARPERG